MGNIERMPNSNLPTPPPLVVILGPTASGKTALGVEIAKLFYGEIICADSRTVYKGLDIVTAKPTKEEQDGIPHYLLDIVEPDEPFSVVDFKNLALKAIVDINAKGKLPIMVGGSGLYVDSVLFDYGFSPNNSPRDAKNPRHLSKETVRKRSGMRPNTLVLGIEVNKEVLRQRVSNRVDLMLDQGLLGEVSRARQEYPNSKALLTPGCKAFDEYILGKSSLQGAKALFIKNDLNLAKRQMTWFKRNKSIHWVKNGSTAVELVTTFLNKYK